MDKYRNFELLKHDNTEGKDFRIVICKKKDSTFVIIAPHGGAIEPGTSEIADRIANKGYSLVLFEGIKNNNNHELHITSRNFDEPRCLAIVESASNVIAIHGEKSNENIVYLGGANMNLGKCIENELKAKGFQVRIHKNPKLQGAARENICNRGLNRKGVQLELAKGLRKTFFESLSRKGRQQTTDKLDDFVEAIHNAICNERRSIPIRLN